MFHPCLEERHNPHPLQELLQNTANVLGEKKIPGSLLKPFLLSSVCPWRVEGPVTVPEDFLGFKGGFAYDQEFFPR